MTTIDIDIECTDRVNTIVARYPVTVAVFSRLGIDTCCGGSLSVDEAARRHGVDPLALCAALRAAAVRDSPTSTRTAT